MLYVFHVDTGTMMTFDINLALESVAQLREAIQRNCGIAIDKQVLLVSGGECLEPTARVCSYSAGTDTNPIFLFSKSSIESTTPPSPSIDYGSDPDLKEEVDQSMILPASIATVNARSQLAQQMCECARMQAKICEKLVHDQHMQQQGWAAVIANLDDITNAFRTRSENFDQSFKQHLDTREQYINILDSFNNDVGTLSKIPVLPALMEKDSEESTPSGTPLTLLQWISSKDNQSSLDQVSDQCRKGLDQFDEKVLDALKSEVRSVLDAAQTSELREIKGLEDRLYGLEQLRVETKKIVQEQTDLAQSFLQNQARASNLGDTSILPDLCMSHKRQLVVMSRNHHQLRDIRRRCVKAKQELSTNLYHRLKWVMFVESRICELDTKLVMYHENVKRLRRSLEVLSQIHLAPNVYLTAVAEVVRRRTFSQAFLVWANDLAFQLCAVHSEEVARRKNFQNQFEGHFLSSLFPGLEDSPPPFATQAPPLFDSDLPKLSVEDIERLRNELPDLALSLSVPDLTTITQFFLNRSITNLKVDVRASSIEDRIVQAVTAAGLSSNLDPALLQPAENSQSMAQSVNTTHPISSDRGFESETDTEEFEKVGQSPSEVKKTESDLRSNLKAQLQNINGAVDEALSELRSNMGQLKQWVLCERSELENLLQTLTTACREHNDRLQQELEAKAVEVETLNSQKCELEQRLKIALESEERERILRETTERRIEAERESKKTLAEQINRSHRIEVEALKARYRLYSHSLERSLGDMCQEKIDQCELIERGKHESIISQLKEELLSEKDKAIRDERSIWEERLNKELAQAKLKSDSEKQVIFNETVRRVVAEKDRLLDGLRVKESTLAAECAKHKETIARLSDNAVDPESMAKRLLDMEAENMRLRTELNIIKGFTSSPPSIPRNVSPSTSIVTITASSFNSRDAATSPDPSPRKTRILKEYLSESTNTLIDQGKISIGSCDVGDAVLVVWNDTRGAYNILQDSPRPHFLHIESLGPLGLQNTNPRRIYSTGEVIYKDFCQAKKSKNRYNVPNGFKFYRVKVAPISINLGEQSLQSSSSLGSSVGSE